MQQYKIYNLSKMEYLDPFSYCCSGQLTNLAVYDSKIMTACINLLKGEWAGDVLVCLGDYVRKSEIGIDLDKALEVIPDDPDLGAPPPDETNKISDKVGNTKEPVAWNNLFFVNHDQKLYVRLRKTKGLMPIPLLIAEGNGKGAGDYTGKDLALVGAWAFESVEIVDDLEPIKAKGYVELPVFFEAGKIM